MKWLILLLMIGLAPLRVFADAHSDGVTLATTQKQALRNNITTSNAKNSPLYTDTPSQTSLYGSASLFNVGSQKITDCKSYVNTSDSVTNQECAAVNFLAKNPSQRITVSVSKTDPIITSTSSTIKQASSIVGTTGSSTGTGCVTKTTTSAAEHSTEICHAYYVTESDACTMGQVVDVTANSNFQCNVTSEAYTTETCHKIDTVTCSTPSSNCAPGGIVPSSVEGDMLTTFTGNGDGTWTLRFGVPGDNYWGSGYYSRSMKFNVYNVSDIATFRLSHVQYDDYEWILVNGHSVFLGPYGGTTLEVGNFCVTVTSTGKSSTGRLCRPVKYCDSCFGYRELNNSWNNYPETDIRPYLVNGTNVIQSITVVGGGGEFTSWFTVNGACAPECTDTWEDHCTDLKAKSL